jgi:hypothetical protein
MTKYVSRMVIDLHREDIQVDLTYTVRGPDHVHAAATKERTAEAVRLVNTALEHAQRHLRSGRVVWGGGTTDDSTRTNVDRLLVGRIGGK